MVDVFSLDVQAIDDPEMAGLSEYEREDLRARRAFAKQMGFPSLRAYEEVMHEAPSESELALHTEQFIENPETHELVDVRTGEVVAITAEPPSESMTKTAKALRSFTKGGEAERIELGTILTPSQQMALNRGLKLKSQFTNAPNIRRTRRTKGLKKVSEMSESEKAQLEKMQLPRVERSSKLMSEKQQERRRRLMMESMARAIELAEANA